MPLQPISTKKAQVNQGYYKNSVLNFIYQSLISNKTSWPSLTALTSPYLPTFNF